MKYEIYTSILLLITNYAEPQIPIFLTVSRKNPHLYYYWKLIYIEKKLYFWNKSYLLLLIFSMLSIFVMKKWLFLFNVEYICHSKKFAFAIKIKFG